jgi:Glycosyl transferase family 2
MNRGRPSVSVVIPCYRYGHYLADSVGSVLEQHDVEVRVLVIDDASPDDSAEVARRLAAEDDRVEVHVHPENRGHIATYNEGLIDWADCDYSVLLSADDVLAPGALARATAVLEAHPRIGFAYGHAVYWTDGRPRPPARMTPTGTTVWAGQDWLRIICGLGHSVVSSPEVVVRTSLQQQIGGYLPELPHTGDLEMWMRFAAHADVAFIKGVDQAYYRIHGAQMTTERVTLVDLQQRRAAYDALFDHYGSRIPNGERLRLRADRQMAKEALWGACRAYERGRMDSVPEADLVEFALATYPAASRLPEYWGLLWRRKAGPRAARYLQPLMVSAVHRRVRKELWWRRWERQGV